jgi:hypothetical protein
MDGEGRSLKHAQKGDTLVVGHRDQYVSSTAYLEISACCCLLEYEVVRHRARVEEGVEGGAAHLDAHLNAIASTHTDHHVQQDFGAPCGLG